MNVIYIISVNVIYIISVTLSTLYQCKIDYFIKTTGLPTVVGASKIKSLVCLNVVFIGGS